MLKRWLFVRMASVCWCLGLVSVSDAVDFSNDIRPILNDHCAGCHGGVKKNGGFSIVSRDFLLQPTDSGHIPVKPGDTAGSELIRRITSTDPDVVMPPQGHDALTESQVQLLTDWVREGAIWPSHWAYQSLPALPDDKQFEGKHPVDWFVQQRLRTAGMEPSPRADTATLARRLSLDLTGLLPTDEDLRLSEGSGPSGIPLLMDQYLSSSHFGERWARHWLDEARYADSEGYEKDSVKEDAYRFRDWVIQAINDDMPFDEFTRKQLAGDLLVDATTDDLMATKFHLQTQFNLEGGVDSEEDRTKRVIDRVGTVGSVWMGVSLACCQCHDHPYDAFVQEDFYRVYAFFNNADFAAEILAAESGDDKVRKIREDRAKRWKSLQELLARQLTDKNLNDDCQRDLSSLRTFDNSNGFVRYMTERTQQRRKTFVFERGDFLRPLTKEEEVLPDIPMMFGSLRSGNANGETPPNRLDLADWLVHSNNPLTARVTVNKIWMHLFGQPLAEQPQEFGSRGASPTHPELLDYLARWFMDEAGWSRKKLIRHIVTSDTWQQSAAVRSELLAVDPNNHFLARQNRFRVEAEIVRDISLQAAGLLSNRVGGKSVFPPIPEIIAQQTYAGSNKYKASVGEDRFRRGLYTFFRRTAIDPNLSTFDCPDSSLTKAQRDRSNNALQALATMHNEVFHEAAQGFARRLMQHQAQPATDELLLEQTLRISLGRASRPEEISVLKELLNAGRTYYSEHPDDATSLVGSYATTDKPVDECAAWITVTRVILNLDEFLTRS